MSKEKIREIFEDEAFVKEIFNLESVAEVQMALKEKGLELTEDELMSIRDIITKIEEGEFSQEQLKSWVAQVEEGEIPEEMLELVSGGIVISTAAAIAWGIGYAICAVTGVAVGGWIFNTAEGSRDW